MNMVFIVRDRLIERGQIRVDQKMMMAGIRFVGTGGRHAHPMQAEVDSRVRPDRRAIFQVDEIRRGAWRRSRRSAGRARLGERRGERQAQEQADYRCRERPHSDIPSLAAHPRLTPPRAIKTDAGLLTRLQHRTAANALKKTTVAERSSNRIHIHNDILMKRPCFSIFPTPSGGLRNRRVRRELNIAFSMRTDRIPVLSRRINFLADL